MSEKPVNYTPEMTAKLVSDYNNGKGVEDIAKALNKSVRSVVAKLTREGIYKKKEYVSKSGEKPVKKDVHADAIGKILNMSENDTTSLAKCNKRALEIIFKALANSKPI